MRWEMRNLIGHALLPWFLSDEIRLVQLARLVHKAKGCAMGRHVARPSPMSRLSPLFWIRLRAINKWFVFPIYHAHPFTLFLTIPTDHHRCLKLEPATGSSGSHTAEANGGCETFMWCVLFVISDMVSSILLWLVELYRAWLLASDPLLDRRDNNHT